MEDRYLFTLPEVAKMTGLTERWLADQCRAGNVEHTEIANTRRMTLAQVDLLITKCRRGPKKQEDPAVAQMYLNRLAAAKRSKE